MRPGRKGETAAREAAREAEQQQRNRQQEYDRQRRQQESQRQQYEEQQRKEQQQREEKSRRQREEERQRDEQRHQDEKRQQDEQQRARERHEAQEAERQPDPRNGQPGHSESAGPTPVSRLFESIRSNWRATHWGWFLGLILLWIAWSVRGNSTPGNPLGALPLPVPLHEMLKELRIGPSLAEVQLGFTENHNLPYELQLMEHVVGRLIEPLDDPSLVGNCWDYSAKAVDGVIEVYMVIDRLVAEVEQRIEAAVLQLEGMTPPRPPFYYRLIGVYTTTSGRRMDKTTREMLVPMAESIYEVLDRALMILRTTEHSLRMSLETLDEVVISIDGKSIRDRYHGDGDEYPGEDSVAVRVWERIFSKLSPILSHRSATGPAYFYGDAKQAKERISSAEATMMVLQDRLLAFQRALRVAPLTTLGNTLELCLSALRIDREELRASQSYASRKQKERRRERRMVMAFLNDYKTHRIG